MEKEVKLSNSSAKSKLNGMEQQMSALSMMGTGTGTGTGSLNDIINNPFYNAPGTGSGVGTNTDCATSFSGSGVLQGTSYTIDGITVSYNDTSYSISFNTNSINNAFLNTDGPSFSLDCIIYGDEPVEEGNYRIEKSISLQDSQTKYSSCSLNTFSVISEIPFCITTRKTAIDQSLSDGTDFVQTSNLGRFQLTINASYNLQANGSIVCSIGNMSLSLISYDV